MSAVAAEVWIAAVAVQAAAAAAVVVAGRNEQRLRNALPLVVSAAVGVLLATGAGHLLPEAIHSLGDRPGVWATLGATMLALWGMEWGLKQLSGVSAEPSPELAGKECAEIHAHGHSHGASRPGALLLGSFTHSFVDGASIAAAFAADRRVGCITAMAVALHEIPHRLGDFALLLHMGFPRGRAAWLAVGAGGAAFFGVGVVLLLGDAVPTAVSWLLPVSAGSFFYISLFDLLPEIAGRCSGRAKALRVFALVGGGLLALALASLPGA